MTTNSFPPVRRLLAILAVSSALSMSLWLARAWYTDSRTFFFLNWNLFLAWIPLGLALLLWRVQRRALHRWLMSPAIWAAWLLFFPNAPYILSDLMHLGARPPAPLWFDAVMLFSFAWNGLLLGFLSLWLVQQAVAGWFGRAAGWLMAASALAAAGFGIYLGRFLRWNSWDLLVDPRGLAGDILGRVANPLAHPQTLAVTLLFGAFLLVAYLTVTLTPPFLQAVAQRGERD